MYENRFSLKVNGAAAQTCGLIHTLRDSNNCMLYNANNLRKTSIGNYFYGGMTYVLNQQRMQGRLIYEAMDGGLAEAMYKDLKPPVYPGLGTTRSFLHLLRPHEELFNQTLPALFGPDARYDCCRYKSIAVMMNRWWAGGPVPNRDSGTLLMQTNPYFEVGQPPPS